MPYKSITNLPNSVREVLPVPAQEIYLAAFNHAEQEYRSHAGREMLCDEVAWIAVKKKFIKGSDGKWHVHT
mgnify:CR=1 FL=1